MKNPPPQIRGRRDLPSREEEASELGEHVFEEEEEKIVPVSEEEKRFINAKMYLMTSSTDTDKNLYNHLSSILGDILYDQPADAFEGLEERSVDRKREALSYDSTTLLDKTVTSQEQYLAHSQWRIFQNAGEDTEEYKRSFRTEHVDPSENDKFAVLPNLLRQAYFFEQVGFGLPREEIVRVSIAMRDIVEQWPIENVRFWGKIFGIHQNYYVVETDFQEGDYESDTSDLGLEDDIDIPDEGTSDSLFDDLSTSDDIKPTYKPQPKIPCEPLGTGLNRKVYFVCSEPGLPWERLPHITPAQVVAARQIRRYFTGTLDDPIIAYPPFPGVERNYLRAQIARISAATSVSPIGYFRFDDQEEEEEAEEAAAGRNACVIDTEFDGLPLRELVDPTLQSWCHHVKSILPQGRNTWYNPVMAGVEGEMEDSELEDREEPDEPTPEVGPPLLSPLSEDQSIGESPAWIARYSSKLVPEYSIAMLQSNTWPGAVTFGADKGRYFETLYVGWGLKNLPAEYDPTIPSTAMTEFPSGPEVTEADDPTPEEEAAFKAALQEKEVDDELGGDEEGEDDED
ncbi:radial spoke head protein 6 homolog A-like [Ylistrum balloti]|uniref:radial spoke head protein 6 homolog A-like n=1 Tax=Ylistrum balloti TaxID=509963 RepID=UPI00290592C6|nr:radial spoke head protein 6 homolog A-like [Ylistrum balloti]